MSETATHPLSSYKLPGIGAARGRKLEEAGITTLEELVDAGEQRVAELLQVADELAASVIDAARSHLETARAEAEAEQAAPQDTLVILVADEAMQVGAEPAAGATPEPAQAAVEPAAAEAPEQAHVEPPFTEARQAPKSETPDETLLRKLADAASVVSAVIGAVRTAEPGKPRRRARRALRKLGRSVSDLRARLGIATLTDQRRSELEALLRKTTARMDRLLSRPPNRRRLRRARRWARQIRKDIEALFA